ncbi:ejaculatory bulb-specific protein 3-like [Aricia agestis]|uniref:ejaculatory bulb-specific protein 3-like n=1 Tax=Aricia agestis TaxID=91739 RepID=UPI001C2030F4|nr:ejaculatory bulb-specific protein 3-like [Aricia agestis]
MKLLLLLPLVGVALAYTDMNDNFIVDTMMQDPAKARKETQELTACLLDEGPCEGFNAAAKNHMVLTMSDACGECDMMQKRGAVKFLTMMKKEFPQQWEKFEKRYDPTRTNFDKFVQKLSVYKDD